MPADRSTLPAGRNIRPLSRDEVVRVANTFLGLDKKANFRYAEGEITRCRVYEEEGETICQIVYGSDIYPGTSVSDPNSSLSMLAAAAHELSHFHRWRDKTELDGAHLTEIDEALTSLDAVQRYQVHLTDNDIRQLVADAIQRLQIFAQRHLDGFVDPNSSQA